MDHFLIRIFGYLGTVIASDTAVFDRWTWLKKNIQRGPIRTLDAGCGSGAFTIYAALVGNNAVGISFDENQNQKARDRAKLLKVEKCTFVTENLNNLEAKALELGKIDQIICFETIEHLLDDRGLLKNFSLLLNSKGRVLLTAPYLHYRLLPGDEVGISKTEDGGHVRVGYTHDDIGALFGEAGLKMIKKDYVTGVVSWGLCALYRHISKLDYRFASLCVFPLRVFTILDPILTPLFHFPHLSIAVVAEKQ